jgi:hypothetical protein
MADLQLIDRFRKQVGRITQFLRYLLLMQQTFPHVMLQLTGEQTGKLRPIIGEWIEFCREIYDMPQLGSEPPNPLPVDPNCPPHLLSDHTRERLGRNAPFFDFVNAPFTHPVGTQISVTCITSAWNAYDTFVNASISELRTAFPNDSRVILLNERTERTTSRLGTDEKLHILEIAWTQQDYVNYVDATRPFKPEQVELLVQAGKDIRTAFTHRFGEPTDRLKGSNPLASISIFDCRLPISDLQKPARKRGTKSIVNRKSEILNPAA